MEYVVVDEHAVLASAYFMQSFPFVTRMAIDNSHYSLILKLGKEMQINHHS
jgi:hypothetical protein